MADKTSPKKPRVRKVETIREKAVKTAAKAETKAYKRPRRRLGRILRAIIRPLKAIIRPLKKPVRFLTRPLRTRPVRFIGRLLGRILWPKYFRNSWKEIQQVTWPSRRDTWKMTFAVIVFAVVFGLAAAGADFVLDKVIRRIVFRS